ncbi:MAG: ornithine cyclodeaminase family protein [Burkholderiaceae bacterium]|jgi:ornithine cyclodeaminase|nr:ornithine cyclodeaminase family protein [Burkholderiaceae bacterium]
MLTFDAAATCEALPFDRLVPALRDLFAAGCEVPPRHVHEIAGAGSTLTSLIMPAWTARHYGIKTVNVAPSNAARGLPGLYAAYLLFDAVTGEPLALMDGSVITARRTAAASALAASWLARADAKHLLVVGAGAVARLLPAAYRVVRPIEHVGVWARNPEAARRLAAQWRGEGFDAVAVDDLEAAARQADVVSCATLATAPIVRGRWLRAGSHLDLIGSFTPAMREADDDAFAGAAIFVDTDEALRKSGELIEPMARGVFAPTDVRGTLAALARGQVAGRASPAERTVFKSVGTALEDLAAAMLVLDACSH